MLSRKFRLFAVYFLLLAVVVSGAKKKKKDGDSDCNPEEDCCNESLPSYNVNTLYVGCVVWVFLFIMSYILLVKMPNWNENKLWKLVFCKRADNPDTKTDGLVVPWGMVATASIMICVCVLHIAVLGCHLGIAKDITGALYSDVILITFGLFFVLRSFTGFPHQGWVDFAFELLLIAVAMTVCAALFIDITYAAWAIGGELGAGGSILANSPSMWSSSIPENDDEFVSDTGLLQICKQYDFTGCLDSTTGHCDGCLVYELEVSNGLCGGNYTGLCFYVPRHSADCSSATETLSAIMGASALLTCISYLLLMLATAQWKIQQTLRPFKTPMLCGDPERRAVEMDENSDNRPNGYMVANI